MNYSSNKAMSKKKSEQRHFIKPSDAKAWTNCARQAWFDNFPPVGPVAPISEFDRLVMEQGMAHEKTILENLSKNHHVEKAQSVEHTRQLMKEGVEVIYQAHLENEKEGLIGYPDFLIFHENGEYQPADAKLARKEEKKEIQVQLGFYRRLLNTSLPGIVYLGTGEIAEINDDANPLVNQFITEMRSVLENDEPPLVRYSHSKCRICSYYGICKPEFEKKGELSLVYGVDARAAAGLEKVDIKTIQQLADADPAKMPDVPYLNGFEKKQRAVLQARSWLTGEFFKVHDFELPRGTWIHFDVEDNPLESSGEKHVYLWGFLKPDYSANAFEYIWTDAAAQDRDGWIGFLDLVAKYKKEYPDLIIAHYSTHEVTTIKAYAKRYNMFSHPIVEWLLGENSPLYDLQNPVLDNFVLPLQGYGLKDICKHKDLVNFQWEDEGSGSQWSIVQFVRFLEEADPIQREKLKQAILGYNRDDVIATRKLEEWLRQRNL